MEEQKKEIRIGLGTFTIIIIAIVLLVVTICGVLYLGHVANVNNGNVKNKVGKQNNLNSGIVGTKNITNNSLINETVIDTDNVYAYACKSVAVTSRYDLENSLVAIDKDTGKETKIMKFNSGAYDFYNDKLYFYENTANSYHRFYEINLKEKGLQPSEIYSFEYKYGTTDNLEYYNNKLYYTFNDELESLDLIDKQINHLGTVKNCIFYIDNKNDNLYYVNNDNELIQMNLKTSEEKVIDSNSGIIEVKENKLLYAKMEDNSETWYWSYDLKTSEKHKLIECWGGEIGKNQILRYNNMGYIYLNGEGQLTLLEDNENMQVLTDEGNFSSIDILPNNKILLERNESEDEQSNYKTYTYNIETHELISTTNNYRYSYVKYTE